tara:strand:+ start:141 stop:473 length:333 start_codon:yes stop_codon:yes gene_type:complete
MQLDVNCTNSYASAADNDAIKAAPRPAVYQKNEVDEEGIADKVSERALMKTSILRDESREMDTDIMATSTTELTHPPVWLARAALAFRNHLHCGPLLSTFSFLPHFPRRG